MLALVLAASITSVTVLPKAPPAHGCGLPQSTSTANHASTRVQKLGELPDAEMDLAVLRSVDGCAVRQVVRFHVSSPGPVAANEPGVEVPGYTGRLVPSGPRTPSIQRVAP